MLLIWFGGDMNYNQLENVIERLYSNWTSCGNATLAAMMCIAHESKGGEYIYQQTESGNIGAALGIFQIEQILHDDVIEQVPQAREVLAEHGYPLPNHKLCMWDIRYSALIFRLHFMRYDHSFPNSQHSMACYLKDYWNTEAGKATPEKYYNDWLAWRDRYK